MGAESSRGSELFPVSIGKLTRRGAIAVVAAVVVNVGLVSLSEVFMIAPHLEPLSNGPVALFTALGVVGATLVYGLLARFSATPDRLFTIIAVVVSLLSLIPDVTYLPTLPGATTLGVAFLAVMHLTAAAICVVVLTDLVTIPVLDR